jgi:copper chaperone
MITFEVTDMTCGRCVGAITRAVQQLDAGAVVQIDLPTQRVAIQPASASDDALRAAIAGAGYTPAQVAASAAPKATSARRGCCCAAAA